MTVIIILKNGDIQMVGELEDGKIFHWYGYLGPCGEDTREIMNLVEKALSNGVGRVRYGDDYYTWTTHCERM